MIQIVSQIKQVVRRDVRAVGSHKQLLTPRAQEITFAVKHHHGVGPPVEHINLILVVYGDSSDLPPFHAWRHFGPVIGDGVAIGTFAMHSRHFSESLNYLAFSSCSVRTVNDVDRIQKRGVQSLKLGSSSFINRMKAENSSSPGPPAPNPSMKSWVPLTVKSAACGDGLTNWPADPCAKT